ncbi:granzyme A-like [Anomaloglossus baeobatrachus]|uniref:granzyme A-like n=1 Tax=Anomaloglossus baeobatrachus TaxID=238106 RepID=UPI003F50002A
MKPLQILLLSAACLLISEGADIINGRIAVPHSRPYMVYIKIKKGSEQSICGGTLIGSKWVVTAAHCEIPADEMMIILGAHSSNENANEEGRQKFHVIKLLKHPNYDNRTLKNDILLMELNNTATFGEFVQNISLPETFEDIEEGTVCETAGWGWTGKKFANCLMEVNVTILNRKLCQRHLKNAVTITMNMTCTNVGPEGQDTCIGDSGGPLICNGVFRGIVSFGTNPCGMKNGAAVYTRLTAEYVKWIKSKTEQQR